jgi:ribose transport system permease protein
MRRVLVNATTHYHDHFSLSRLAHKPTCDSLPRSLNRMGISPSGHPGVGEAGPDVLPPTYAPEVGRRPRALERLQHATHTLGLAFAVVAFGICFTILNPNFGNLSNLGNIVSQSTILGIMATGMTFAIVSGEIDLSVGSMFALTSMVFGLVLQDGAGVPAAVLVAVLVGVALGATNGLLSVAFNVPTIIITLGTLNVYAGIALWSNDGLPVSNFSTSGWLFHFSQVNFGGPHFVSWIPQMAVAWLLILVVGSLLLTKTRFGLKVLATGSSQTAARFAGISFQRVRIQALALVGATAAIAGVLSVAQYGSASPGAGAGYNLTVIAAVIIGGAALTGGRGSVIASALGVLLLGEVNDGLIVAGANLYIQIVAQGALVILAVAIDRVVNGNTWYVTRLRRRLREHRQFPQSSY